MLPCGHELIHLYTRDVSNNNNNDMLKYIMAESIHIIYYVYTHLVCQVYNNMSSKIRKKQIKIIQL